MGKYEEVRNLIKIQDEHWIWKGAKIGKGYGAYNYNGIQEYAHRIIYKLFYGEWPDVTCHLCEYRRCVRPEHIRSGDYFINNQDSAEKRSFRDFKLTLRILFLRQQGLSYRAIEKEIQRRLSYVMIGKICRIQEKE